MEWRLWMRKGVPRCNRLGRVLYQMFSVNKIYILERKSYPLFISLERLFLPAIV